MRAIRPSTPANLAVTSSVQDTSDTTCSSEVRKCPEKKSKCFQTLLPMLREEMGEEREHPTSVQVQECTPYQRKQTGLAAPSLTASRSGGPGLSQAAWIWDDY